MVLSVRENISMSSLMFFRYRYSKKHINKLAWLYTLFSAFSNTCLNFEHTSYHDKAHSIVNLYLIQECLYILLMLFIFTPAWRFTQFANQSQCSLYFIFSIFMLINFNKAVFSFWGNHSVSRAAATGSSHCSICSILTPVRFM